MCIACQRLLAERLLQGELTTKRADVLLSSLFKIKIAHGSPFTKGLVLCLQHPFVKTISRQGEDLALHKLCLQPLQSVFDLFAQLTSLLLVARTLFAFLFRSLFRLLQAE